jgi:hypothetical protein
MESYVLPSGSPVLPSHAGTPHFRVKSLARLIRNSAGEMRTGIALIAMHVVVDRQQYLAPRNTAQYDLSKIGAISRTKTD